jgi:hypothetical protein
MASTNPYLMECLQQFPSWTFLQSNDATNPQDYVPKPFIGAFPNELVLEVDVSL